MARVQFGALITEIVGSIGGFTFQRNRSGTIIRLRPTGQKKVSDIQTQKQALHTTILANWQGLTLANKTLWNDFADLHTKTNSFGQTKTLSGLNWYESVNQNLTAISELNIDTPPVFSLPIAPGAFAFIFSSTELKITFLPTFLPSNESLLIRATPPMSVSSQALQKDFRLIKVVNTPPFSTIDLKTDWENYFNIPYPPASSTDCFNIAVMVQTVEKTSGITSVGVISLGRINEPTAGIGFMQIGTTFIVTGTITGIGAMQIGTTFVVSPITTGIGFMAIGTDFEIL